MTAPRSPSSSTSLSRIASGIAVASAAGWGLVAVAIATATARAVLAATLVDVGEQGELARALHRAGDLRLVATARAGDAARADLPLLGDELAQGRDVLVVDLLDLVATVLAGLAAPAAGAAPLVAPAHRLAAASCLGHQNCSVLSDKDAPSCSEGNVLVGGGASGRCGLEIPFV